MARNLYILSGTLLFFGLVSFGMSFMASSTQPGLPGNGTLWKTTSLFLALGGLLVGLLGVMTAMFEQVDRRAEERRLRAIQKRRGH